MADIQLSPARVKLSLLRLEGWLAASFSAVPVFPDRPAASLAVRLRRDDSLKINWLLLSREGGLYPYPRVITVLASKIHQAQSPSLTGLRAFLKAELGVDMTRNMPGQPVSYTHLTLPTILLV